MHKQYIRKLIFFVIVILIAFYTVFAIVTNKKYFIMLTLKLSKIVKIGNVHF